ncbi:putative chromatin remodeler Bromodomain family [Helianthus annuus]|uniref:Chromatin remodeler Bromodomain family n=1 Tax=Helianthus annuus TaxID=4232 RepID=A0A251RPA0_HELAN|nr:transcription factor GTE9 [Helianthus annuus]KAF5755212.1 putative chromatin remodeler Bromodomain family [Helianthus annuus]KAJ0428966.1 putative chromatin remodeler Bromodomain family [Helianthus annuus]KAJ0433202.1 putative chromatin remodeler Bromodomain family [Helianthus annuus]KAJ0447312.1 putative chromatin remodeler Bromodomain family [Helianthus annuus]KAJ0629907.1 putative chromatin remodeler Bromodomain family [Helianthus annuus]
MSKKNMFPDAYSGGFPPNDESEGSGCSGRDDVYASGFEDSSVHTKKWIKLSAALHDGFGVPVHVVPLSKLAPAEKKKWLMRLRGELDQLRTFQKRVDVDKPHVVTMSSSNDVFISENVQAPRQPNMKKSSGSGKRFDQQGQKSKGLNRGVMGRFQSVNPAGAFSPILKKQCESLLKKLMTHQHGWVFNKPVDVVALKIPDYFNVIKNPMDLGTIKEKLSSGKYSSPLEFLADVRLTFSNAMTYNPPGNDVHIMADVLSKFFELRWKPIEKKLPVNSSQQQLLHEEIDLVKPVPPSKKRKITSIQQEQLPDPVKLVMTNEEKQILSRELLAHLGDMPDNIIEFLRQHSSNGNEAGEDEIEIDIDDLDNETLFKLRKMLDDHVRELQNNAKAEPCVIELLHESGLSNSTMQLYRGNDPVDEDADVGGNEPPVSSYTPAGQENGTSKKSDIGTISRTSSDINSRNASENGQTGGAKTSSLSKLSQNDIARADLEDKAVTSDLIDNQSVSGLDQVEHMSQQKPNSVESDSQKDDGDSAPNSGQFSPGKSYRAAVLKNRFADTIFKAREKTLNEGDPEKLRREKEELENQKRKEKARLQAAAEAAENARRRAEAEAALEAKRKRDLEREAARQALLKIEKTVEIDETSRFIEDLEMLRTEQLPISADETSPDHGSLDALGSFNFGSSNPLEQLGLYMKQDDEHEEEDDDGELEPPAVVPGHQVNMDVEEGEID